MSSIVHLNVGGTYYTTSMETLTNAEPGSYLHSMFSGEWATLRDEQGRVFIDRDGQRFRHVLNFLRSGCLHVPRDDENFCTQLLEEADFLKNITIQDRSWLIKTKIDTRKTSISPHN